MPNVFFNQETLVFSLPLLGLVSVYVYFKYVPPMVAYPFLLILAVGYFLRNYLHTRRNAKIIKSLGGVGGQVKSKTKKGKKASAFASDGSESDRTAATDHSDFAVNDLVKNAVRDKLVKELEEEEERISKDVQKKKAKDLKTKNAKLKNNTVKKAAVAVDESAGLSKKERKQKKREEESESESEEEERARLMTLLVSKKQR